MNEQTKIKTKIFKLLQKASSSGCSEFEAIAFAEKAGALMDQFSLTITDIQIRQTKCDQQTFVVTNSKTGILGTMAVAISRFCDVKVWATQGFRYGKGNIQPAKINFFGLESDVEIAMFLMSIVKTALQHELAIFKKTSWWKIQIIDTKEIKSRSATAGFTNGFGARVCRRLTTMKQERDAKLKKEQDDLYNTLRPEHRERTARNLVEVKTNHVKSEFAKLRLNLHGSGRRKLGGDHNARSFGGDAANRVGLNIGINKQKTTCMITG